MTPSEGGELGQDGKWLSKGILYYVVREGDTEIDSIADGSVIANPACCCVLGCGEKEVGMPSFRLFRWKSFRRG